MPHAEETMSSPLVNGEKPHSLFLDHLTSYPVVSDSITTFKSNPYGARSLSLAHSASDTFLKPVLPYAQRPYAYVSPYVSRADELASSGLTKVDSRFPIVKEDTSKIKGTLLDYVHAPFDAAGKGRDYVLGTWGKEYKKCGGDGYVAGGKAVVTTSLIVTQDFVGWLKDVFYKTKEEGTVRAKELKRKAEKKVN